MGWCWMVSISSGERVCTGPRQDKSDLLLQSSRLSQEKWYMRNGHCFKCGKVGRILSYKIQRTSPKWTIQRNHPRSNPNPCFCVVGSPNLDESTEIYHTWRCIWDQQSLLFFDLGACANLIFPQFAEHLGIREYDLRPQLRGTYDHYQSF